MSESGSRPADPRAAALLDVAASLDRVSKRLAKRSNWQIVLLVVVLIVIGFETAERFDDADRREQTRAQIADTRESSERIRSCTDPNGECYRRGQQQTASAVASLVLSDVRVSECVVASAGDVPAFRACVKAKGLPLE
jgi:hypothetical protein